MLDVRIVGGTVVDGTGAPPTRTNVAVRDGRLVPDDGTEARQTIDAGDLVVAPGFIDVHTHYDAQVFWDPALTPSPLHGVTTVIAGNCGFSLAPARPGDFDYLVRLLARVEGMPLEALRDGVTQSWETTGELLDVAERMGVGVNVGFLTGHSAIRRRVMGERAVGERATPEDVAGMVEHLRTSLRGGSLGFSTSFSSTHSDGDVNPVPSRWADDEEILALSAAVGHHDGTGLEIVPDAAGAFEPEEVERMTAMSLAADRPLNWNVLIVGLYQPALYANRLAASDWAAARGACVKGLVRPDPSVLTMSFATGMMLESLSEDWHQLFRLPPAPRLMALRDPAVRRALDIDGGPKAKLTRWAEYTVGHTTDPANVGRTVAAIAAERGTSPFDTVCDLVIEDELATGLNPAVDDGGPASWRARRDLCRDPRMLVGGSDAGGHLDIMCGAVYSTRMIAEFRARDLLPLEEVVRLLTDVPARYLGLRGRGRVALGYAADLVVFDPATTAPRPLAVRCDLPGGAERLFAGADGIEHLLVNGTTLVRGGATTDARPGTVLRSGRDTSTVTNAAALAAMGEHR